MPGQMPQKRTCHHCGDRHKSMRACLLTTRTPTARSRSPHSSAQCVHGYCRVLCRLVQASKRAYAWRAHSRHCTTDTSAGGGAPCTAPALPAPRASAEAADASHSLPSLSLGQVASGVRWSSSLFAAAAHGGGARVTSKGVASGAPGACLAAAPCAGGRRHACARSAVSIRHSARACTSWLGQAPIRGPCTVIGYRAKAPTYNVPRGAHFSTVPGTCNTKLAAWACAFLPSGPAQTACGRLTELAERSTAFVVPWYAGVILGVAGPTA